VARAVEIYNNTPHSAFNNEFTPMQVQMNKDLEEYYIREQLHRLDEIKKLQYEGGYFNYRTANVLLVHIESKMMDKKRRVFNRMALFIDYDHGNVLCKILEENLDKPVVTIPIYHTKLITSSIQAIPEKYLTLIF
jgi:hypothetical protein